MIDTIGHEQVFVTVRIGRLVSPSQGVRATMGRLERVDAELHEIVSLRCYGGLTIEQVAELLGTSSATVKSVPRP